MIEMEEEGCESKFKQLFEQIQSGNEWMMYFDDLDLLLVFLSSLRNRLHFLEVTWHAMSKVLKLSF